MSRSKISWPLFVFVFVHTLITLILVWNYVELQREMAHQKTLIRTQPSVPETPRKLGIVR